MLKLHENLPHGHLSDSKFIFCDSKSLGMFLHSSQTKKLKSS